MSQHEPEATPRQQEAVRRLLAQARHDQPVPPEVAARLEGVLAGLVAEGPRAIDPPPPPPPSTGGPGASGAPVVDLAARRRRRAVGLLGAAAAVIVLGVGVAQVVDTGSEPDSAVSSQDDAGSDDGPAREEGGAAAPEERPEASQSPLAPGPQPTTPGDPPSLEPGAAEVPVITSLRFAREAQAIRDREPGVPTTRGLVLSGRDLTSSSMFVCDADRWGEGRLVAVTFQGMPAVLAFRPPAGNTQAVELLQCGSADVLRSTVVPYP